MTDYDERYYPDLNTDVIADLKMLLHCVATDPDYLDEAPYEEQTILFLRSVSSPQGNQDQSSSSAYGPEDIEIQIGQLMDDIKDFGREVRGSDDNAAKNTYFRVSTSLLEKLVDLKERVTNVKQIKRFQEATLSILEDVLDKDQRARAIKMFEELEE